MWLKKLLAETEMVVGRDACEVRVDNQRYLALSKNANITDRTKNIEINIHLVRDKLRDGTIVLKYVPTELNSVDMFKKVLSRENHKANQTMIGMAGAQ